MNPTTHHRFGALRSLLNREPSTEVWSELLKQLELWSGDALEGLALPYVREHLRRWPDTIPRSPGWDDHERWRRGDDSGPTLWLANHMQIDSADQLARLASHPLAAQITSLALTSPHQRPREDHAAEIAASLNAMPALRALGINAGFLTRHAPEAPALIAALANPSLRSLSFNFNYNARLAEALLSGPQLDTLELLRLWHPRSYGRSEGAGALLSSPRAVRLTTLDLSGVRVSCRDAARMAELPARLTTLILRRAGLTDAGIAALLRAPALDTLTSLDLSDNKLGAAGARAIAESPRMSRLEKLELLHNAGAIRGLPELLGSPHLRGLRSLDVIGRLSADLARRIADVEWPPHLATPLYNWKLGADAGEMLARIPAALRGLESVRLQFEGTAPAAQAALLRSPFITALRHLEIVSRDARSAAQVSAALASGPLEALELCHIIAVQDDASDVWVRAVAANTALRQLKELAVWGVVTDGAQQALAQARHLQRLESLWLHNNAPPGAATLPALIASLPALRELYAGGALSLEAAQGLASCAEAARLEELYLCVERGEAASALLSSPHLQQLKRIHISPLGDAGCEALARTPLICSFSSGNALGRRFDLDLRGCEVTPAGLAALLSSPHLSPTFSLDLSDNPLGDEGAALLAAHPTLARITDLSPDELKLGGVRAQLSKQEP